MQNVKVIKILYHDLVVSGNQAKEAFEMEKYGL